MWVSVMKRKNSNTRQGVRDLSYIAGKSNGIRLQAVPSEAYDCNHKNTYKLDGERECRDCGRMWDWDGNVIN